MLVTALNQHIGYDSAARVAKYAFEKGLSLKQSVVELGVMQEAEFDKAVIPGNMTRP